MKLNMNDINVMDGVFKLDCWGWEGHESHIF